MGWLLEHWFFTWPGWIAWSTGVVLLVRILLASAFRRLVRRELVYAATYLSFPILLVIGFAIVGLSGMPMYGFDSGNWKHWLGYFTLFFSPFGLPLILGTPVVLVIDFAKRLWRGRGREAN